MARRRGATRHEPLPTPPQEGVSLRTGQRDAEIGIRVIGLVAKACGETVSIWCRSIASSDGETPSIRSKPVGTSSSSRIWTAPTQSRPMAFSNSNGSVEPS